MKTEREENPPQRTENRYFRLMEVVGTEGRYQTIVLAIFCALVFQVGSLSLGNPYYFAVAPYVNCPDPYKTASECNNYVCSLPQSDRNAFLEPQIAQLHTIGNQFGDYHCQKSDIISTAMGMFFLGSIVGYFCIGSLVDNFGRKLAFNLCLGMGLFGKLLLLVSPSLPVAQLGLFLLGFGLQNSFNLCFYFLSEVFSDASRQRGGIIIQSCFCVGGLATILWFYLFKTWKLIFWVFYFLPLCVMAFLSFILLRETPQFLVKRYQVTEMRKELRRIAKMNGRISQFQSSEYTTQTALMHLKTEYQTQMQASDKKFFNFLDLFRYKSLRKITLSLAVIVFSVDFLYYAPLLLIDQFGFNFYANGVLINISELITYFVSYRYIARLQRRRLALWLFAIALGCSFLLLFLHHDSICEKDCWNAKTIFELLIVFVMRFVVSLQFQVLIIYINELYPTQVAGVGLSFASIIGTLPNVFIPELVNLCNRYGFPVMIFFIVVSLCGLVFSRTLRQTKGCPVAQQVQQFGTEGKRRGEVQLVEEMS